MDIEQFINQVKSVPAYADDQRLRELVDIGEASLREAAKSGSEGALLLALREFKLRLFDFIAGIDSSFPEILKDCEKQYQSQLEVARRTGLFNDEPGVNAKGSMFMGNVPSIVRGNSSDTMPTWSMVQESLRKNKEIVKEKNAQGFTKMLIVPFGYDLKTMAERFKQKVRELDETVGIYGAGGEKIGFKKEDNADPVYIWSGWDESQLVYYPKKYTKDDHGGLTKEDVIKINGAWQICFVEDMPVIPSLYVQKDVIGKRRRIDRVGSVLNGHPENPTIHEFKEAVGNLGPKYNHEKEQTPEQYLWMQLTSLLTNAKPVLMDYESDESRGTYLIGCFNVSSLDVPIAGWSRSDRQFDLGRRVPVNQDLNFGIRPLVNI